MVGTRTSSLRLVSGSFVLALQRIEDDQNTDLSHELAVRQNNKFKCTDSHGSRAGEGERRETGDWGGGALPRGGGTWVGS